MLLTWSHLWKVFLTKFTAIRMTFFLLYTWWIYHFFGRIILCFRFLYFFCLSNNNCLTRKANTQDVVLYFVRYSYRFGLPIPDFDLWFRDDLPKMLLNLKNKFAKRKSQLDYISHGPIELFFHESSFTYFSGCDSLKAYWA